MDQPFSPSPSPLPLPAPKRKINFKRLAAWGLCGIAILTALHLQKLQIDYQDEQTATKIIQSHIQTFWELEKARIDKINTNAEKYITYYKLNPGDPLPPSTFYDPKDPTWKRFNTESILTYSGAHKAEKNDYSTTATTLATIRDVVPPKDEHYAYIGVVWNPTLFTSSLEIYPQDKSAFSILKQGHQLEAQKHSKP